MKDWILDKSVYFSFDSSGFLRHKESFDAIDESVFKDKRVLITGGTSGIGEALAHRLLDSGANVLVTGRSEAKFNNSKIKDRASFYQLDLANFENVKAFPQHLEKIDYLVCNAGGMPEELKIINDKFDTIFASQVVGHYLLIKSLHDSDKLNNGASVHINSSGGMYLVKLDLSDLKWQNKKYDKVASYANAKRAQVILTQELPSLFNQYTFSCSHPGWVGTDAVKDSIPGFYKVTKDRLRNSKQGADTMYWALASGDDLKNGGFYFDRMLKDPYPFFWTKESPKVREQLIKLLTSQK